MPAICQPLQEIERRIRAAERRFGREEGSVKLVAVSKTQPPAAIAAVADGGQHAFGENYVQEALPKIEALASRGLDWHFIGHIQANKTLAIATNFAWVHTIDRLKVAARLNAQRPRELAPLDCCIEVNISNEASKSGVSLAALPELVAGFRELPRLRLRGLMSLPAPAADFAAQRAAFRALFAAMEPLRERGLDTLSMGTSADFEAAIAEGATLVRIGTALFGPRG